MATNTTTLDSKDIPVTLHTSRLILRMADPDSEADCLTIVKTFNDANAGKGGNNRVGVSDTASVRAKHKKFGPQSRPDLCTLAPPPKGMFFFIYLPTSSTTTDESEKTHEPEYIGFIALSFRPEMPFPDLGYGVRGPFEGKGYASEAGKRAMEWWRDVIGVKEMWVGTLPDNVRSQRCAERIGFVRAGTMDVVFGDPPDEAGRIKNACGFMLPGMEGRWPEGKTLYPTINASYS